MTSQHGAALESFVQHLCSQKYLEDLVFPSPKYTTEAGREREAADVLLVSRRAIFSIQLKSRMVDSGVVDDKEAGRAEKKFREGAKQVKTLRRALESGQLRSLRNHRGVELSAQVIEGIPIVGIVIVELTSPMGSDLSSKMDKSLALWRDGTTPIHAFLRHEFELLVSELDTLPDLLGYLNTRRDLVENGMVFSLTRELDLLGMYLCKNDILRQVIASGGSVLLEDGIWESLQENYRGEFQDRRSTVEESKVWDRIVNSVHRSIGFDIQSELSDSSPLEESSSRSMIIGNEATYFKVLLFLSDVERSIRIKAARKMYEKAHRADEVESSHFMFQNQATRVSYVFNASNLSRAERVKRLEALATISLYRMKADWVVGIDTNSASRVLSCEHFLILDGSEFQATEEGRELASKFFGEPQFRSLDEWGRDVSR